MKDGVDMTNQEFQDEINAALGEDAHAILDEYHAFEEYQRITWKTLIEINEACAKHGVSYQLTYGTLLGAIRDGGQIPWDYDVDIVVPIVEREAFIDAINKDMKDGYYCYGLESDPNCDQYILRVCPLGFDSNALHVDVFFYVGAPDEEDRRLAFTKVLKSAIRARIAKKSHKRLGDCPSVLSYCKHVARKALYTPLPMTLIDYRYWKIARRYPYNDAAFVTEGSSSSTFHLCYPKEMVGESKLIRVEDVELPIPVGCEQFLTMNYGDWRQYAPLDTRIREFRHHYRNLLEMTGGPAR